MAETRSRHGGWIANYQTPRVYARHIMTVHVPRRPYVDRLPGIPTIRVFEALACGIPLMSAAWNDEEHLFTPRLGLSITSSRANGHATTYRALARGLASRGHAVTFLEQDAEWSADNRDLEDPSYCRVRIHRDREQLERTGGRWGACIAGAGDAATCLTAMLAAPSGSASRCLAACRTSTGRS